MRLLITGWQGQVSRALGEAAARRQDIEALAIGRPALDLVKLPTILRTLTDARPDVVINTAAYTAVDQAETDVEAAFALNRDGAARLAEAAAERGLPIIHLSTDYVFDGLKAIPYVESDPTGPRSVYGRSKLEGERAVMVANPKHLIVRTAWLHSSFGQNFVRTMLQLAREKQRVRVVGDQLGSPTSAEHLAVTLLDLAAQLAEGQERFGILHAAGRGEASWAELAREVFARSQRLGGPSAEVEPITTAEYPTRAERPKNSRLDTRRLETEMRLRLPDWREGVDASVRRLLAHEGDSVG
ncbi:MAG: dTDP-4-dehydrorhamnose reductase [Hyphomicrobiaceae bacterium]